MARLKRPNVRLVATVALYFAIGLGYPVALWCLGASQSPHPADESYKTANQHESGPRPISTDSDQPSPKPTAGAAYSYTYNYYYPSPQSRLVIVGQVAGIVSAILLTVFTGGLWATSVWQWWAIDEQAEIANETLSLQFRPRIRVRTFQIQKELAANEPLLVQIQVANIGSAPALIVESNLTIFIQEGYYRPPEALPMKPPYDEATKSFGYDVVPAGRAYPMQKLRAKAITKEEFESINMGNAKLYILGYIFYKGESGNFYRTAFCRCQDFQYRYFIPVKNADYEHED